MSRAPGAPKASLAKVAYHTKQLGKILARAGEIPFLQLIWATDALQSGRSEAARAFLTYPAGAADGNIASAFAIHRWELETLIIQLFLTATQENESERKLDCSKFDTIRDAVNRLRSLENVESALYLAGETFDVFSELHRIAQRQFHWQRGYFNPTQFYRYFFMCLTTKAPKSGGI